MCCVVCSFVCSLFLCLFFAGLLTLACQALACLPCPASQYALPVASMRLEASDRRTHSNNYSHFSHQLIRLTTLYHPIVHTVLLLVVYPIIVHHSTSCSSSSYYLLVVYHQCASHCVAPLVYYLITVSSYAADNTLLCSSYILFFCWLSKQKTHTVLRSCYLCVPKLINTLIK